MLALLFTSCDKEEPQFSPDVSLERQTVEEPTTKEPLIYDDQNFMVVENLTIKQGERVPVEKIQRLAPDFWATQIEPQLPKKSNSRAFSLDTVQTWGIATTWNETCNCGTENCPRLGAEIQGLKVYSFGSLWLQLDSEPASHWWGQMVYDKDSKGLTNYGSYHYMRHINYNSKGTLHVSWWLADPDITGMSLVFIDIDGPLSVPDYGLYTWWDAYNETKVFSNTSNDENAIKNFYTSCGSCDACN